MQPNDQDTSQSPQSVQPAQSLVDQNAVQPEGLTKQAPVVTIGQVARTQTEIEDIQDMNDDSAAVSNEPVRWEAYEYISPDKNTLWYVILGVFVAGIIALDIFVLKAWTVSVLAVVIAAVLVVMSVRPARKIQYSLTDEGLYIGTQLFDLTQYRAFGVVHDGKENSVFLIPVQRFRPGLSVYFPEESGEAIVDSLGARLPMQDIHLDFIDQIVKFLRI